jgi:uncharacterized membrane protein
MTDTGTPPVPPQPAEQPPGQASAPGSTDWLKLALVASLALNLLFLGFGIARFAIHQPMERFANSSQMQLIPRKFLGEVGGERRRELLQAFKSFGPAFREGRRNVRAEAAALADALDAEPYDPARVNAAVARFTSASAALMQTGGQAAEDVIGRLKPEERKLLARHIRLRDSGNRMHRRDGGD